MNNRVKAIATWLYESSINLATSPEEKLDIAIDSYRGVLEEYTFTFDQLKRKNDDFDGVCKRLGKLTAALQALQEDDLHILLEGGDAIVDAKSKVRKRWMMLTGLTYDEIQEIAPMKPGHEL